MEAMEASKSWCGVKDSAVDSGSICSIKSNRDLPVLSAVSQPGYPQGPCKAFSYANFCSFTRYLRRSFSRLRTLEVGGNGMK